MALTDGTERAGLLLRGRRLEQATLTWNVIGVLFLATAAVAASSVALVGFGLDSLVEVGASTVVLWELADAEDRRQPQALRLLGWSFLALSSVLLAQSSVVLAVGHHARSSVLGVVWTGCTVVVMTLLAAAKTRTGRALGNEVLLTEGRVTRIDAVLAAAVLAGLVLDAAAGLWWADPVSALVVVGYGLQESRSLLSRPAGT